MDSNCLTMKKNFAILILFVITLETFGAAIAVRKDEFYRMSLTNASAYSTNITIFRSNSVPLIFSNNIHSAFTNLAKFDYVWLPQGEYNHGTNSLICNADNVTVRGQGEATKIIGYPAGPQIIPGTNNFTLDNVVICYDYSPLQNFLNASGEESYSQGLGVPSAGVSATYLGSVSYWQRPITNLVVLNSRIRSQADCFASGSNGVWNAYFKNSALEYAWDGTVGGGGKTNWAIFDNCRLDYLGVVFTNEFGALGSLPRMVRSGGFQRYIFNNCVGKQSAALVNLFDTGACEVNGGNWVLDQTSGSYTFNPQDIVGSTTINGVFYSTGAASVPTNRANFQVLTNSGFPAAGVLRTNGTQRALACITFKMQTDLAAGYSDIAVERWHIGFATNISKITLTDDLGGSIKYGQILFPLSPGEVWKWSKTDTGDVFSCDVSDEVLTSQIYGQ